uniref:Uncharacterized protein n=1 Tax=Faxonius propinquus nudivirus TaxID=3139431 RepID=A0AAU8GF44_9VIRU
MSITKNFNIINFKSCYTNTEYLDTIVDYYIPIFKKCLLQAKLIKFVPLSEKQLWGKDEIKNFEINFEDLDFLYHMKYFKNKKKGLLYEMVAKMKYNNKFLFIELEINTEECHFDCCGVYGTIYMSYNANLFYNVINAKLNYIEYDIELMKNALEQDDNILDDLNIYNTNNLRFWCNDPIMYKRHFSYLPIKDTDIDDIFHDLYKKCKNNKKSIVENIREFIVINQALLEYYYTNY